jgi:hypothetical protein
MFKVLILIFSVNVAPQDCQRQTATDVIAGPIVSSELSCGLSGQVYLADTALRPSGREYVKVQCSRTSSIANTGASLPRHGEPTDARKRRGALRLWSSDQRSKSRRLDKIDIRAPRYGPRGAGICRAASSNDS